MFQVSGFKSQVLRLKSIFSRCVMNWKNCCETNLTNCCKKIFRLTNCCSKGCCTRILMERNNWVCYYCSTEWSNWADCCSMECCSEKECCWSEENQS